MSRRLILLCLALALCGSLRHKPPLRHRLPASVRGGVTPSFTRSIPVVLPTTMTGSEIWTE